MGAAAAQSIEARLARTLLSDPDAPVGIDTIFARSVRRVLPGVAGAVLGWITLSYLEGKDSSSIIDTTERNIRPWELLFPV